MLSVFLPKVHSADRWPVALQPVAKCHPTKKHEAWILHWKFRTWLNCTELMGCQHKVHKVIKSCFMAVIHSSLGSAGCIPPCSSEKCAAVKSPSRLTVQKGPWWRGVPRARPQSPPASAKFFKAKMLYYALFIYFRHVTLNLTGIPGATKRGANLPVVGLLDELSTWSCHLLPWPSGSSKHGVKVKRSERRWNTWYTWNWCADVAPACVFTWNCFAPRCKKVLVWFKPSFGHSEGFQNHC